MSKDTITVELPIERLNDGSLVVGKGYLIESRDRWREIARNPRAAYRGMDEIIAPAVVAWIERDEWEPLDLPAEGRKIQATLRDGRVETFKVGKVEDDSAWAYVSKADSVYAARYIERRFDENDHEPNDIIAWHYVDDEHAREAHSDDLEALVTLVLEEVDHGDRNDTVEDMCRRILAAGFRRQPTISAEQVEAIVRIVMDTECEHSGSCEVGSGDRCSSPENGWLLRSKIARRIRAAGLLTEGEGESDG